MLDNVLCVLKLFCTCLKINKNFKHYFTVLLEANKAEEIFEMKWTTANIKNPNYTENHELYVGTHTGSFKKLMPANEEKPYAQSNLLDVKTLEKDSKVTALAFGNEENSEILIGHAKNSIDLHCLRTAQIVRSYETSAAPIVGMARYENALIAGLQNGQIERLSTMEADDSESLIIKAGDNISRLRQCATQRNIIATGGKERQNNLKIFDMAADGKQIFTSKNLPNDFLQLEVPVWDSDVAFIDEAHTIGTCSRHGYVRVYDTRKQRRPVQCFASEEPQMSFTTLTAKGNYIYAGTTMGAMKAFDIRRLKSFVHTYKGFTGGISDLYLDPSGKFLASASLDRYVRVHHTDSCVLLYQCYVKSKAMRILLRESLEKPVSSVEDEETGAESVEFKGRTAKKTVADDEYDQLFDNMQTICEGEEESEPKTPKSAVKRKSMTETKKNKKKKA